jgi:opacity protein-like surface antigen
MVSVRVMALAGAAALFATIANAADMPKLLPPVYMPPVEESTSGWYLRGDIGMTNQRLKGLDNALFADAQQLTFLDKGGFDSAPLFGFGFGYMWNSWLRFDATVEYRGKAGFHALDRFFNPDIPGVDANDYYGAKSEWLGLVNAYVDLGTWGGITPFLGAGLGVTQITISHFRDVNVATNSVAYGDEASKINFAWALHAGLGYKLSQNATLEFAYRYTNLGDAESGDLTAFGGGNFVYNPMIFKGITSHDLKLGLRYMFD